MSEQAGIGPVELNSSNTSIILYTLQQSGSAVVQCTANTDLILSLSGSTDGATFTNLPSTELDGTAYAEGASITVAAGTLIFVPAAGLGAIKITRVSGTGTVSARGSRASYRDSLAMAAAATVSIDAQFADDAAFTPATSKVLAVGFMADETSPDSVNEGDVGAGRMTLDRRIRVETTNGALLQPSVDSYTQAAINLAAGANQQLVAAPGANKQIWVYGIGVTVNVAGTVSFQDEDDTAITGIMQLGATGGFTAGPSGNFAMPLWKLATNKALEVDVVTSELDGWIAYAIVSV